ncbi:MAG TPA: hypothetical protein VFV87_12705 [Pirellulaceae bacterium]|nr:hypothetical protein [Pirellulaceae bacterium]
MSEHERQQQLEYPYTARPAAGALEEDSGTLPLDWLAGPTWLGLIGVAILFALANLTIFALMENISSRDLAAPLVYWLFGAIAAQPAVLSAWLVWGSGSFWKRLALHWGAAYGLAILWLIGAVAAEGPRDGDIRNALEIVPFSLPLLGLAIQLPLWAARMGFGWRLVDSCADDPRPRPLAIRDLMVGTVIVAVSLAAAKLAEGMDRGLEGWLVWAILAPSVAGISLIAVLPVAAWILRQRNLVMGMVLTAVYAAIAVAVTWVVMYVIERNFFWVNWRDMLGLAVTIFSFAATLAVAALAARVAGFRLATGHSAPVQSADPHPGDRT